MSINLLLFLASAICFGLALLGLGKFDFVTLGLLLLALGHVPFGGIIRE